jgi:hypothetical protein
MPVCLLQRLVHAMISHILEMPILISHQINEIQVLNNHEKSCRHTGQSGFNDSQFVIQ